MNKNLPVFAFGIILIACLAGNAHAQTELANNVVINEVEIGEDMQNDWVELYNPTDKTVDIGGWIITSFVLGGPPFTIPLDTMLNPGEFIVYEQHGDWFLSDSSLLQLHDDEILVDYSTLIVDRDLDSQTWFRSYDGVQAMNAEYWKYGNSTKNASNHNTGNDILQEIEINTDLDLYSFGDSALITGRVSEIAEDPNFYGVPSSLTLVVSSLDFEQRISLYPDNDNLGFTYDLSLNPTLGFNAGPYTINASYGQLHAVTSFNLVEAQEESATASATKFLQIQTDASVYNPGQTVMMSGSTNVYIPYKAVTYSIIDPNGSLYKSGTLFPREDGTFAADFQIIHLDALIGMYRVTFEYSVYAADHTFEVAEVDTSGNPIDISFDKNAYSLNDKVKITGTLNDVTQTTIEIVIQQITHAPESITMHLDKVSDSIRTINSKDFSYEYLIHNNADRLGKYKVTFTSSDIHEERIFAVVLDPENYILNTKPFTIASDMQVYNVGDDITFTGAINGEKTDITGGQVVITMTDPGGNKLTTASAKEGSDHVTKTVDYALTAIPNGVGEYTISGTLFRSLFTSGMYEATANYADDLYVATMTFEVVDPIQDGSPFVLHVDKNIYDENSTVLITAEAPRLELGSKVTIKLQKPDGEIESFEILSDESSFDWSWTTPNLIDDSNRGVYSAAFTNRLGTKAIEFTVGAEPVIQPLSVAINTRFESGSIAKITGFTPDGGQSVAITIYDAGNSENILYMNSVTADGQGTFALDIPLVSALWDEGSYMVSASNGDESAIAEFKLLSGTDEIRHTAKFPNIRQTNVMIDTATIDRTGTAYPRIIQGTLVAGPYGTGQAAGITLSTPSGICIVGYADSCIVHDMTMVTSDGPYVIADVDGTSYKVRYSGSDANIETFTVLLASAGQVFDDSSWNVEIHDAGLPTKFHYKITYVG